MPFPLAWLKEMEKFADVSNVDLIKKLLVKKGFNASYKDNYFFRRLHIRMRRKNCNSYETYYYLLNRDVSEFNALKKNLSINVTSFFRNPDTYDKFRELLVDYVKNVVNNKNRPTLRIWSAGCAVGAEPYTIAMVIDQVLKHKLQNYEIKIMATDFNEELLSIARRGIYDEQLFLDTAKETLQKYFDRFGNSQYRLKVKIRRMVDFSYLDLMASSFPFKQLDAVFCRNVMIYFSKEHQDHLFNNFHNILIPNGILVLGRTETISPSYSHLFKSLSLKHRVYQRNGGEKRLYREIKGKTRKHTCSYCSESFYRLIDQKIHERRHLTEKTRGLYCKICGKLLANELRLKVHMRYAHQINVEERKIARVNSKISSRRSKSNPTYFSKGDHRRK
ncbi:MAG: CheR family methyltransferase [Candidatus Hodarchaeales archaeon]|jgi:chemotaxis protein methyltransferase CheR